MKKPFYIALLAASCYYMQACNDNRIAKNYNQKTLLDDNGISFIYNASEAGNTEIAAANLAEKNSQNPRVINYAKMMIADHTAMAAELKKFAASKYVNTTLGDSVTQEHKTKLNELKGKTGADFDKSYMQTMVADHQKVLQMFHDVTNNTSASLISLAEKNMSKIQMHLDSARAISASLK